MNSFAALALLAFFSLPAWPCTCVSAVGTTAKSMVNDSSVVFRGSVTERTVLPPRAEMKGRGRYAITFRIEEYWKGSPGRTLVLYGVDDGTDCLGGSSYAVGKEYLVYASEREVTDVILEGGFFWYGWTDVLTKGTRMLVTTECTPSGETTELFAKKALRELGRGRSLAKN